MVEAQIQKTENKNETKGQTAFRLLIKRILAGSLVILFIGGFCK